MNWYKQIKIASPAVMKQDGAYTSVGHGWYDGPGQEPELMEGDVRVWQMGPDFSIKDFMVEDASIEGHREFFSNGEINTALANGRLVENGQLRVSSLSFNKYNIIGLLGISRQEYSTNKKVEYLQQKIINIVDGYFNNPEIRLFGAE